MNRPNHSPQRQRSLVRPRGQPLLALALLMVSWVGARAALWEAPAQSPDQAAAKKQEAAALTQPVGTAKAPAKRKTAPAQAPMPRIVPEDRPKPLPSFEPKPLTAEQARSQREAMDQSEAHYQLMQVAGQMPLAEREANLGGIPAPNAALPMPLPVPQAAPQPTRPGAVPVQSLPRWSGDAWLLWRPGSNLFNAPGAGLPGAIVPSGFYGGSQAGAVLRYRLAPDNDWRPTLYLRAASGVEWPRGEEAALGFAFRPLPKVPVAAMVEGRATRTLSGMVIRPAAALVTELPPARLPGGLRGEAYLQAGYVGGRDATGFVDGQARIERPLVQLGRFRLRAGGGVWGGAQRGAQRLDIGPTATLELPLGGANSRLSADYRFRVAGRAAPGSGPAVTVSVGF